MFGLKLPWVSRRRLEVIEDAYQDGEAELRRVLRDQQFAAAAWCRRCKDAEAELAAIKAKRSAATSQGNRTRYAKRRVLG